MRVSKLILSIPPSPRGKALKDRSLDTWLLVLARHSSAWRTRIKISVLKLLRILRNSIIYSFLPASLSSFPRNLPFHFSVTFFMLRFQLSFHTSTTPLPSPSFPCGTPFTVQWQKIFLTWSSPSVLYFPILQKLKHATWLNHFLILKFNMVYLLLKILVLETLVSFLFSPCTSCPL